MTSDQAADVLVAPPFDIEKAAAIALTTYSISIPIVGFLTGIVFLMYLSYIFGTYKEPTWLKIVTSIVTLAIIADFVLEIVSLQKYTTSALTSPTSALRILSINIGQAVVSGTTCIVVQFYFASVVYRATGSSVLWLGMVGLLMTASCADGLAVIYLYTSIVSEGIPDAESPRGKKFATLYLFGACSVASFDVLVTCILCRIFFSNKRKAIFGNTRDVLTRLLITTLETFFLTTTAAVAGIILVVVSMRTNGLVAWRARMGIFTDLSIISRLYAISLLYTLNRRAPLRANVSQQDNISLSEGIGHLRINHAALEYDTEFRSSNPPSECIRVHTGIVQMSDEREGSSEKHERLRRLSKRNDLEQEGCSTARTVEAHPLELEVMSSQ